jgi:hypothetical protein
LVTIPNAGSTILCTSYYFELPQTTAVVVNGTGENYNLTTWHGTSNLSTLLSADVHNLILKACLQDGPIALLQADFNLGEANIDAAGLLKKIHAKILKLEYSQICLLIYSQLCPDCSNQPHTTLDHIYQTAQGPNGHSITLTVVEFYQCLMNALHPFQAQHNYIVSICNIFIQKLDHHLLPSFCCHYPGFFTLHCLDATSQHRQLSVILAAAQDAKYKVHQVQDIACLLVGQGFYSTGNIGQASAYPSQEVQTLTKYSGTGNYSTRQKLKCWGCGKEDHAWRKGRGPILCPLKDNPEAIEHADAACKEWVANRRKRGGKGDRNHDSTAGNRNSKAIKRDDAAHKKWVANRCKRGRNGDHNHESTSGNPNSNRGKMQFIKCKDMTSGQQTKMRKDVLAATTSSTTTRLTVLVLWFSS